MRLRALFSDYNCCAMINASSFFAFFLMFHPFGITVLGLRVGFFGKMMGFYRGRLAAVEGVLGKRAPTGAVSLGAGSVACWSQFRQRLTAFFVRLQG